MTQPTPAPPRRVLYLATADARGHLMRAQLLTHALRAAGDVHVDVLTTSAEGVRFLAQFGVSAGLLSTHYAVQFDAQQHMHRGRTDANVAAYVAHPGRLARDLLRLRRLARRADLVVNDSFHPALLVAGGLCRWRRKIVHVHGTSLREALQGHFRQRGGRLGEVWAGLFARGIGWMLDRAGLCLEHDFACEEARQTGPRTWQMPTPVALARGEAPAGAARQAAVYLNPHFRDPALAQAIEDALAEAGLEGHLVGEGHAGRPGWQTHDADWVSTAAHSAVLISAPGMAALSAARVYRRPIVLLVTDQPEQARNAARAVALGLRHRQLAWRGGQPPGAAEIRDAVLAVLAMPDAGLPGGSARDEAQARLAAWVGVLRERMDQAGVTHRQADGRR